MSRYVLLGELRDEDGRWLFEQLDTADPRPSVFYRRRYGSSTREQITYDELARALATPRPVPDYSRPDPAGVYEQPAFGPRGRT